MPLDIQKPEPLMVGDKAYYTLSSYEPAKVTVRIAYVTDSDLAFALQSLAARLGATEQDLDNPAWIQDHLGVESRDDLAASLREGVEHANEQRAEEQKVDLVVNELVQRLKQRVPTAHVLRTRDYLRASLESQLAAQNLTLDTFLLRSHISEADFAAMLDAEALESAEESAALDAFARERKLTVSDDEIPALLGIPQDQAKDFMKHVRASGQLEELREAALRSKAAAAAVAEADVTYERESPEEGEARFDALMQELGQELGQGNGAAGHGTSQGEKGTGAGNGRSGRLRLV